MLRRISENLVKVNWEIGLKGCQGVAIAREIEEREYVYIARIDHILKCKEGSVVHEIEKRGFSKGGIRLHKCAIFFFSFFAKVTGGQTRFQARLCNERAVPA